MRAILLSALLSWMPVHAAQAYCYDPSFSGSEPSGPFSKPSVPYCLSGYGYSREHTCDAWEIQSYQDELDRYIRDLQSYSNEASEFANEAIDYANAVTEFAVCQAKEVAAQHE